MIYAVSGSHSTGKTTLLTALMQREEVKHLTKINGITRYLPKSGIAINTSGSDLSQTIVMSDHWARTRILSTLSQDFILDRCVADGYAYTRWAFNNKKVSEDVLSWADFVIEQSKDKYKKIFYLPIEFDLELDGVREDNKAFQIEIDEIIQGLYKKYNLPVIRLTGTVEERVQQIIDNL